MICSKYIPEPAFAFKMYCWRDLLRANMNSESKTACMGIIGNTKNPSSESSMSLRISRVEGAKRSLFYERHGNSLSSSLATFLLFRHH
ncbi:hypothetical protein VIGAN_02216500 [Vigna angularis var. angularis]|uniref:Uncharacterized protein n=1 Tax=Vigna angularis var. angularis TaxID=157739 RepID=A0A0S3RF90_PHAAN|nr:hypothetical protein VIGAN_02216500 [Vigna angularis var. angularis]